MLCIYIIMYECIKRVCVYMYTNVCENSRTVHLRYFFKYNIVTSISFYIYIYIYCIPLYISIIFDICRFLFRSISGSAYERSLPFSLVVYILKWVRFASAGTARTRGYERVVLDLGALPGFSSALAANIIGWRRARTNPLELASGCEIGCNHWIEIV